MMNWEKDKRIHMAREANYEYYPRIGSLADQRRWERENGIRSSSGTYKRKQAHKEVVQVPNDLTHYLKQLNAYLNCVNSAYFWKKSQKDRNEVTSILAKLIEKLKTCNKYLDRTANSLLVEAELALIQIV